VNPLDEPRRIDVSPDLFLSEIKPSDKGAFLEHFKDKRICDNTLVILLGPGHHDPGRRPPLRAGA
jgi:hypothetical protein